MFFENSFFGFKSLKSRNDTPTSSNDPYNAIDFIISRPGILPIASAPTNE